MRVGEVSLSRLITAAVAVLLFAIAWVGGPPAAYAADFNQVSGRVTDDSGAPLQGAWVDLYEFVDGGWEYFDSVETDASGSYMFGYMDDGTYTVGFWNTWTLPEGDVDLEEYWSDKPTLDQADAIVLAGTSFVADAVIPSPRISIKGHVAGDDGAALQYVWVDAYQLVGDKWEWKYGTSTNASGDYAFGNLADGQWKLGFGCGWTVGEDWVYSEEYWSDKATIELADVIELAGGTVVADAVLAPPTTNGTITGQVSSKTGVPLSYAMVNAYQRVGDEWYLFRQVVTDESGAYTLAGLPQGQWRLGFGYYWDLGGESRYREEYWDSKETLEQADTIVLAGDPVIANAALRPPNPSIHGTLSEASGRRLAYADATVYAKSPSGSWFEVDDETTSDSGEFTFYDLPPGTYRIGFYASWNTWYGPRSATRYLGDAATLDTASDVLVAGDMVTEVAPMLPGPSGLTLTLRSVSRGQNGWDRGPTYAELSAPTGYSMVPGSILFSTPGSAETSYAAKVRLPDGQTSFSYRSTVPGGAFSYLRTVPVKTDSTPPTTPRTWISNISSRSVEVSWDPSTDGNGSGVARYSVSAAAPASSVTTRTATIPKSSWDLGAVVGEVFIRAVDYVGLESVADTLTVTWPTSYASTSVVDGVPRTLTVGSKDYTVGVAGASTPGDAWVAGIDAPFAPAPQGYRFTGDHFTMGFTGTLGAGRIDVTAPYDGVISAARAKGLLVGSLVKGQWVMVKPASIDTAKHAVSFSTTNSVPVALLEPVDANKTTAKITFDGRSASTTSYIMQAVSAPMRVKLTDSTGAPLSGRTVVIQSRRFDESTWKTYRVFTTSNSGTAAFYRFTPEKTYMRAVFQGGGNLAATTGPSCYIVPKHTTSLIAGTTKMKHGVSYRVKATIMRPHAVGTRPVRIYKYRYVSGKWKSYGYVTAKVSYNTPYGATCYGYVKLPYKGKWKLLTYAPADAAHAGGWGGHSTYVTAY